MQDKDKGFTIVELMIVIAIIAIIAAIAIPHLVTNRISANESSCSSTMKLFTSAESQWYQGDPDGNGRKDYWTYDISCLHRLYKADNATKVAYISIDVARADWSPADLAGNDSPFGSPRIENWSSVATGYKSGYWFRVLAYDLPGGNSYLRNNVGTNNIPAGNSNKYGFMAVPDVYGITGVNSYIVNQEGTVYATDTGLENDKWKTTAVSGGLNWPSLNPPSTDSPSGRKWATVQ